MSFIHCMLPSTKKFMNHAFESCLIILSISNFESHTGERILEMIHKYILKNLSDCDLTLLEEILQELVDKNIKSSTNY